jgi:hypothetical protein
MLETVVSDEGTARAAELPGVRVAGKTGTAQKWETETGTYSQTKFRAWFIGIAPADDPRIVIVSELDEPKHPIHTGGAAAAPLFAAVAPGQLAHRGIFLQGAEVQVAQAAPPAGTRPSAPASEPAELPPVASAGPAVASRAPSAAVNARPTLPAPAPPTVAISAFRDRVLLPDFTGLSKDEVTQVTAKNRLRVELRGDGLAVRQDPPPGSVVAAGSEIVRIQFRPAAQRSASAPAAIAAATGSRR